MTKQEIRREVRLRKKENEAELASFSVSACSRLMADGLWRSAGTVLLYHALPDEVDVTLLIDMAWRMGKRVLLPVVVGDDLVVREYAQDTAMQVDKFGIKEPVGADFTDYESVDLVIVPGMAFDKKGHRVGRGKGYYDRLLPRLTKVYRMGVCFPFQLFEEVPSEHHDIVMHEVIC